MFKQIFRLTFVTFIWKQYKRIISSTVLLFLFLWLVGFMHAEYLEYAKLQSQTQGVSHSFFIKWLAMAAGVIIYLFINLFASNKNKQQREAQNEPEDLENDPFAAIRQKKHLRSRSEIMTENDNNPN